MDLFPFVYTIVWKPFLMVKVYIKDSEFFIV